MQLHHRVALAVASGLLLIPLSGCPDPSATNQANTPDEQGKSDQTLQGNLHEGEIKADQTWTKAASPHIVRGTLYVQSAQGATLTIEPGAEVRFEPGAALHVGWNDTGILKAVGTATESITFTTTQASKVPGAWGQIYVGNGGASTILSHCKIMYGGGTGKEANDSALYVNGEGNKPTVRNCTFENNAGIAVSAFDTSFTAFENNTITTSGENPIQLSPEAAGSLGAGNRLTGNGNDTVLLTAGTVSKSVRWRNHGIPYRVMGTVFVQHASNAPVLTVDPGSVVQFAHEAALSVAYSGMGALHAVGTSAEASESITFTSLPSNKAPGAWSGIYMGDATVDGAENNTSSTRLRYVTIEYAGDSGNFGANLYVDSCKPLLEKLTLRKSAGVGIQLVGELATIPVESLFSDSSKITYDNNAVGTYLYPEQ
ncbi:right-handed parallel beta-helix repeat-containing protein [bacterium]|nr:right-handed parallel beta-helix repeat-containing protein [bacterium]